MLKTVLALAGATVAALAVVASASAHASVSPPVALAKKLQVFTLAVPTEESGAATTKIELTLPKGFAVDSVAPAPGWKFHYIRSLGPSSAQRVEWSGGDVPTGEDAVFQFLASTGAEKNYTFDVRQTYSNGKLVDWNGPESSDTPSPTVQAVSSLGGGGSSTWGIVALIVAIMALLLAIIGLAGKGRALA